MNQSLSNAELRPSPARVHLSSREELAHGGAPLAHEAAVASRGAAMGQTIRNRRLLLAALVVAVVLIPAIYLQTFESIVSIWIRTDTYSHGFLVAPISAYLIWRRRHLLNGLEMRPAWIALPFLLAAGVAWILGTIGGVLSLTQFAMVGMIPLLVWLVAGSRISAQILFPLGFLLFAVPFGDFALPVLMDWTALATVGGLRFLGVPVYQEGLHFIVPSGAWSVVEACGGVRYLIASAMMGFLYAYTAYQSPFKRIICAVVALILPILANWLRALLIVLIAHASDNKLGTGIDHLFLGWVLFGIIILSAFWLGRRWEDEDPVASSRPGIAGGVAPGACLLALAVGLASIIVWPGVARSLDGAAAVRIDASPISPAIGWTVVPERLAGFRTDFKGARQELTQTFKEGDTTVGLDVLLYAGQHQGSEMIMFGNELVNADNKTWKILSEDRVSTDGAEGHGRSAIQSVVKGPAATLLARQSFWIEGYWTSDPRMAKFYQVLAKILGRGDRSAVVVTYTAMDLETDVASAALDAFTRSHRTAIESMLAEASAAALPVDSR
ncbi:MAG: exosortase A [Zoogloeaceae bacterium]|nr:exosortase A [Zoogloeaceae bacterium]MCW5616013.1 exosortase A [Rhodocyclaceae bacterium]